MKYHSTRNNKISMTSMEIIKQGLSSEGGLFVPETIPKVSREELKTLIPADYRQLARRILSMYLTDYSESQLAYCVDHAYADQFSSPAVAPVTSLVDGLHILELWHGPTCAFKDMALQILPYLMTTAIQSTGDKREIFILTATSGDTGKAALEGFRDVPGTGILVFYPLEGVSSMQKLQMITQEGENVSVAAVKGNFDDAQTGVKRIFRDAQLAEQMEQRNLRFSSANSINWGRLVPQIVYYFSSYLNLVKQDCIALGQNINIVVPTGNFGNILAAWYAKEMGLPVNRLICASNDNNVLTDFIRTGVYDKRRSFYQTISPSMDILVSSNLERLLYELCERDDAELNSLMEQLSEKGYYSIEGSMLKNLQSMLWGGYASVEETMESIRSTFRSTGYTMDPHTAVGKWVYNEYCRETGDYTVTILASTASPFKFPGDVLQALKSESSCFVGTAGSDKLSKPSGTHVDEIQLLDQLAEVTGLAVPAPLQGLRKKKIRHTAQCSIDKMKDQVAAYINSK
ncbi:MAG: threonine synthase [Caldicoprobacterales bacterium]|nr:threonine synthase [Clostridiales bacterium]